MPRTRSQQGYDSWRASFLDATWAFLLEQGYEQATLNRLITHAGTSKGAFYHYFDSREELMTEVVDRAIRDGIEELDQGLGDQSVSALEKLNRYLGVSTNPPSGTIALRRLLLQVQASRDLALLDRLRQRMSSFGLAPLERIIEQGVSERVFDTPYPSGAADVIQAASDRALSEATRILQNDLDNERAARDLLRLVEMLVHTSERLLGLEPGKLERLSSKDVRALVEKTRKENLQ